MGWSLTFWASIIQGYGPPTAVLLLCLRGAPELQMLALFCSLIGVVTIFPSSFVYLGAGDRHPAFWFVLVTVLSREVARALVCLLVVKMENVFRAHQQVIHSSRFRLIPTGIAIGFGFGVTQVILKFGTTAEAYNRIQRHGAEYYNLDACPQLPFLYFQALQSNLNVWFEMVASSIMLPCVAAIVNRSSRRFVLPTIDGQRDGSPGDSYRANESSSLSAHSMQHADNGSLDASGEVATATSGEKGKQKPAIALRDAAKPSTSLKRQDGVIGMILVVVFHLLFGGLSLLNEGSVDTSTSAHRASRGCTLSLPLQLLVLLVFSVVGLVVAKLEVIPKAIISAQSSPARTPVPTPASHDRSTRSPVAHAVVPPPSISATATAKDNRTFDDI